LRHVQKLRWGFVLAALALPALWLSPGCGARSDLEDGEADFDDEDAGDVDGGPDALPDVSPDVQPDVSPDVQPDVSPDVQPDVSPDVQPDVLPDVTPDVPEDVIEDVPLDVSPDVPPDVSPDVPDDVPPDVPPDVPDDVPPDVPPDVPDDVPADVSMDAPFDAPIDIGSDVPCPDNDGDGYTTCEGDCDDNNPLINPGAFDFPNGIDDDCEGLPDNPFIACGAALQYTSQDPIDYARAIDLCQQTTEGAMGAAKKWGLISAELVLADGTGTPAPQSHSIVTSMGSVLGPRKNENFAFFSTGLAAVPGQPYYQFGTPQGGTDFVQQSAAPPGFPTNKVNCPLPLSNLSFDPVSLKLKVRTPTNANSLGFEHSFFSAEYPEFACTQFNDIWVALLNTGAPGIANNKNVIFDNQGTPGSVNLNFFDRCVIGPTGCAGGTPGFNFCAGGSSELSGTGYEAFDAPCGVNSSIGGATGWITTEAPILPGEIITIQFAAWDSSDGIYDSAAILDNFHWLTGSLPNPKTSRP
jgi:hypothetical protein